MIKKNYIKLKLQRPSILCTHIRKTINNYSKSTHPTQNSTPSNYK